MEQQITEQELKDIKRIIRLRYLKYISRGLIISLPIIIILFLVSLVFGLILKVLAPISLMLDPSGDPHWMVHILSFILLIGFFYFVGKVLASSAGRRQVTNFENEYLMQIPLYSTVRDLVQQFAGIQKLPFSQVVLVDPFDSGVLMTGFVTEEIHGDIYTVFVPTAPNPTNGNIYHVPASRLHFINVSSETAMRTVVGMGTGSNLLFTDTGFIVQKKPPVPLPESETETSDVIIDTSQ